MTVKMKFVRYTDLCRMGYIENQERVKPMEIKLIKHWSKVVQNETVDHVTIKYTDI